MRTCILNFYLLSSVWLWFGQVQAGPSEDFINGLAQACYSIQSPKNGNFLQKFETGGSIDDGLSYRFENSSEAEAARFFMKPTSFGNYLLTDTDGRYLASHITQLLTAGRTVGKFSEWNLKATNDGQGGFLVTFLANGLRLKLRHNDKSGKAYFFDWKNPLNLHSESAFKLVTQSDCKPFPEITVNVHGNVNVLKGNPAEPVRGFVEAHAHITAYEFMGGKMMHGKPFHPWGVETALQDSKVSHGPNGSLDLIGNIYTYNDIKHTYDTRGWPDFPYWPNHQQMSHLGYYYKWIERAYLSGMRIMVTDLVENKTLCEAQIRLSPTSWIHPNSCNEMESIRLQARRLHEMEEYIDAQAGGPGKGFFRLVSSPAQARQVIANGQLAVVVGVEASETFNCGIGDYCTPETIKVQLDELYNLGVRSIFPTHKFDNQIGGSQVREGNGFVNLGHYLNAGYFWQVKACDSETRGTRYVSGFPLFADAPLVSSILGLINADLNPKYDESIESCNKHGLSELGVYLVNQMIDKKMMIELDHSSSDSSSSIMDIAEARSYSGVISSHSWMSEGKTGGLHRNTKRIIHAGGYVSPMNDNASSLGNKISAVLDEVEQTPFVQGVGFSTDMSGLGGQAGPRANAAAKPLAYPYISEFGLKFDKQVSGNRIFDLNKDGVAHYGMVADHVQDIREQAPTRVFESVMNSAEAYLQMWERAEANSNQKYVNPL